MGMNSKYVASKRVHSDCEEEEVRKRTKPSLELSSHKDDARFKSPASPAPIQLKADGISKRPAEVFRTDFITAMKVPDNHTLAPGRNYELVDTWRQEWEKGVQVAVNPDILPKTFCREKEAQVHEKRYDAFSMPKARISYDSPELLHASDKTTGCLYDLDDLDVKWLQIVRNSGKKGNIDESLMEKAMTYFERKCFENMAHAVATKKGLSIEYDETTTCDVCLSPDTEESNEILFCDACNMCVHQACYGIPDIPTGTWLCRPCSRGVLSPPCIICPNRGGAMKRIKGSFEWIHVICAWWVPEVKIEDTDNVEKMTVDKIPASRKNLCCLLCREKVGACIQCSVKRCVVAYHVTCAVKEGLEMKTVMMQDKDDVQHISYCKRHCVPQPLEKSKPRVGDNVENQRLQELQKLQEKFFKLVSVKKSARELRLTKDNTSKLFGYWVLKRKANENRPLIPLTTEQQEKLSGKQGIFLIQEQINVEVERYSLLRQDLERLRNLCYLIIRRERVKKEVHKASQDVFYKQNDILESEQSTLTEEEFNKIASGNELMKFTKFPSYSMYGPPFADHLGEEGTAEDETSSSGVCLSDGASVGLYNEASCSYTSHTGDGAAIGPHNGASCSYMSYTGDGAAVGPHVEASSNNYISCGDGNENVDVKEVIPMKDTDQQPPQNATIDNVRKKTADKIFHVNGIKTNLIEEAKEIICTSNICPQIKAARSVETMLTTNSLQQAEIVDNSKTWPPTKSLCSPETTSTDSIKNSDIETRCLKDTTKVVQTQAIDSCDGQSNVIDTLSESQKIESKSSEKVDTLSCIAYARSCRTPKGGRKGAVKRVLRSSPRDAKSSLDVELPVKKDLVSRLGNTELHFSAGPVQDDIVKCQNVDSEIKKRLGLNHSDKGVSRRPPRRITRSCGQSIDSDLCETDGTIQSVSQGTVHTKQNQPNEIIKKRDSTNVGFDIRESSAVGTQETTTTDRLGTPDDNHSDSSDVTKSLEQSEVITKDSTDILNISDLVSDKDLKTNIDESSTAAYIPNGNVDTDCKVDPDTDQIESNDKDDEIRSGQVDCLISVSEPEIATEAALNIGKEARSDLSVIQNCSLENGEKCGNLDSSSDVCLQPDAKDKPNTPNDAKDTPSTEIVASEAGTSSGIQKCAQQNNEELRSPDLTFNVCLEHDVKDSTNIGIVAPETESSMKNLNETIGDHKDSTLENVDLKPGSLLAIETEREPSSASQTSTPTMESSLVDTPQLYVEQQVLNDEEIVATGGSFNEKLSHDVEAITTANANHTVVNGHCSESSCSQKENDSPNNETTMLPKHESNGTKEGPGPAVSRRLSFDIEKRDETYLNERNFFDRFMDSSNKNPVVLLNELSGIERMKEERPTDLNGLNSSPRKTKKISDVPSPAFPRTVIDDLIACPQRLTRGRTQLMMMDGHRGALARKGYKNRRKSHHFSNQKSDPDIPRLTRRRLRSFGLEKLDLINSELINEAGMTSSYSPRRTNIGSNNKNTLTSNTELEDVFLKDVSETSALDEITGSPTRLTRARVRSLGLGYGKG